MRKMKNENKEKKEEIIKRMNDKEKRGKKGKEKQRETKRN